MTDATSPISSRPASEDVTLAEIEATERILRAIDHNNAVLASASQWLLVWKQVRDLALRFERLNEPVQQAVLGNFVALLQNTSRVGSQLATAVARLNIAPEHLRAFANCSQADLGACVAIIDDFIALHSAERLPAALVEEVWRKSA